MVHAATIRFATNKERQLYWGLVKGTGLVGMQSLQQRLSSALPQENES